MALNLITPPTCWPLHINDVKQHLRQDIADDDNLIGNVYLPHAVQMAQQHTQRQLVSARYRYALDAFPCIGKIDIPLAPLIQVVSIQYTDDAGATQTVSASDYVVDTAADYPRIGLADGASWPTPNGEIGCVRITLDAGYVARCTADQSANTITVTGWRTLAAGDIVRFSNSGGALPSPLKPKTDYFIRSVAGAGVYTLAASSGGSEIDLTDQGSGLQFVAEAGFGGGDGEIPASILAWILLQTETHYQFRGGILHTSGEIVTNPFIDRLLDPYRVVLL